MIARTAQIIMLLLFAGNLVSSSEEQKIAELNETLSTLGFKSVSSDVVKAALKSYDYDADEALLYLIENQDKAENNETLSALGLFNSDDVEAVLTSHDYDIDKALSALIESEENQDKSQDTYKTQIWTQKLIDEFAPNLQKVGWKEADVKSLIELAKQFNPNEFSNDYASVKANFSHMVDEIVKFRLSSAYLTAIRTGQYPQFDPNLTNEVLETGFNTIIEFGFGNQFANHEILFALMEKKGDVEQAVDHLMNDNKRAHEDQRKKIVENISQLPAEIQEKIDFFSKGMKTDNFASANGIQSTRSKTSTGCSSFDIGEVGKGKGSTQRLLTNQSNEYGNNIQNLHDSNILNLQQDTTNHNNVFDQTLDKKQLWSRKLIEDFEQDLQKVGWESRNIKSVVDKLYPNGYTLYRDYADVKEEFSEMVDVITSTFNSMEQKLCDMGFGGAFTSQQIGQALLKTKNLNVDQAVNYLFSLYE